MGHPAASIPIPAGLMADHSGTSGALPILQRIPMHNFLVSMVPEQADEEKKSETHFYSAGTPAF